MKKQKRHGIHGNISLNSVFSVAYSVAFYFSTRTFTRPPLSLLFPVHGFFCYN
jgi:hypothetical protein